jgi:hypothetical protein
MSAAGVALASNGARSPEIMKDMTIMTAAVAPKATSVVRRSWKGGCFLEPILLRVFLWR